jgi:hypothetical protein
MAKWKLMAAVVSYGMFSCSGDVPVASGHPPARARSEQKVEAPAPPVSSITILD